jgi:hypothetical protein
LRYAAGGSTSGIPPSVNIWACHLASSVSPSLTGGCVEAAAAPPPPPTTGGVPVPNMQERSKQHDDDASKPVWPQWLWATSQGYEMSSHQSILGYYSHHFLIKMGSLMYVCMNSAEDTLSSDKDAVPKVRDQLPNPPESIAPDAAGAAGMPPKGTGAAGGGNIPPPPPEPANPFANELLFPKAGALPKGVAGDAPV